MCPVRHIALRRFHRNSTVLFELCKAEATPEAPVGEGTDQQQGQQANDTKELMRLSEALEEVDALRVSVQSRDAALQAQVGP